MIVDFSRVRVQAPSATIHRGRFLFQAGRAAVWTSTRIHGRRTATRNLFATDATFTKAATARNPHVLTLSDGTEWLITQTSGGCGCGGNPLSGYSIDQLLADDFSSIS